MKAFFALGLIFSIQSFAAEESTSRLPAQESASRAWASAGLGSSYVEINQNIDGVASFSQSASGSLSQHLEAGYLSRSNWGGRISYSRVPTQILAFSNATSAGFNWSEVNADAIAKIPTSIHVFRVPATIGLRAGF